MSNPINTTGQFHLQNLESRSLESSLKAGGGQAGAKEMEKLQKACMDFESIFIKQMLDSMRKTVVRSELTKKNMGEDLFEDMLYDEYAKKMSDTAGLGIGDMMYSQLSRQLPSQTLL